MHLPLPAPLLHPLPARLPRPLVLSAYDGVLDPDLFEAAGELGRGGFGTVMAMRHVESGEVVAVKRVERKQLVAASNEAMLSASLSECPGVLGVREVHLADQHAYMLSDVCHGGDLRALLQRRKAAASSSTGDAGRGKGRQWWGKASGEGGRGGGMAEAEALEVVKHVGDAVAFCHERGVNATASPTCFTTSSASASAIPPPRPPSPLAFPHHCLPLPLPASPVLLLAAALRRCSRARRSPPWHTSESMYACWSARCTSRTPNTPGHSLSDADSIASFDAATSCLRSTRFTATTSPLSTCRIAITVPNPPRPNSPAASNRSGSSTPSYALSTSGRGQARGAMDVAAAREAGGAWTAAGTGFAGLATAAAESPELESDEATDEAERTDEATRSTLTGVGPVDEVNASDGAYHDAVTRPASTNAEEKRLALAC
ncbi:unnamed protein product [Closterium sp. Naga37s-1]|nr:unnamed protein product [Closterium sp. Naga37s-1]